MKTVLNLLIWAALQFVSSCVYGHWFNDVLESAGIKTKPVFTEISPATSKLSGIIELPSEGSCIELGWYDPEGHQITRTEGIFGPIAFKVEFARKNKIISKEPISSALPYQLKVTRAHNVRMITNLSEKELEWIPDYLSGTNVELDSSKAKIVNGRIVTKGYFRDVKPRNGSCFGSD